MSFRQRILWPSALLALLALPISCGSKTPTEPIVIPNKAPDTEITHVFGNEITYTFSGTDTDGSIDYISVRINDGAVQNVSNGSYKSISIIPGTNSVEAIAYDNKGLADSSPAKYSFISPTESQARATILSVLNAHSSSYQRFEMDALLSLGASGSFPVDFLITRNNGTNAVVCYVSHLENLTEELANQELLKTFGIPPLYLPRIPEDEIRSRLNDFISNGFINAFGGQRLA